MPSDYALNTDGLKFWKLKKISKNDYNEKYTSDIENFINEFNYLIELYFQTLEGFLLYVVRYHNESDDTNYASPFLVEKIDGKWEIRYDLNRSFYSPHFEANFKRGKLTGSGIVRLNDLYADYATEVVSREQTNAYFETLTDVKRQEIQQHINTREAYYD